MALCSEIAPKTLIWASYTYERNYFVFCDGGETVKKQVNKPKPGNCFLNRLKVPPTVNSGEMPEECSLSLMDWEPQELGF